MPHIHVHLLPLFLKGVDLDQSVAVVIDILRASTTITHALVNGAERVIPTQEVEQALRIAARYPKSSCLLGGERACEQIAGFDLDNSPLKYTPEVVGGKTIIFTTTNGTKALNKCAGASEVVIGAFVNLTSVVEHLHQQTRDVHLVCAGTNGQFTGEDILFAGAVVDVLLQTPAWKITNDQAQLAREFYSAHSGTPEEFRDCFIKSLGAQNLLRLNMLADIERCYQRDLFTGVPIWNPKKDEITLY